MKNIMTISYGVAILFFCSCSKNYNCVCTNPGGSDIVFTTRSSKSKADEKCRKYYDDHFGSIPMNETNCVIE